MNYDVVAVGGGTASSIVALSEKNSVDVDAISMDKIYAVLRKHNAIILE